MTHFIILPPQKNFSRTLQILGFIAESGRYGQYLHQKRHVIFIFGQIYSGTKVQQHAYAVIYILLLIAFTFLNL